MRKMIWSRSEWCERGRAMGAARCGVALFICCLLLLLLLLLLLSGDRPPTMREAWTGFNKTQSPPLDCVLPAKIDIVRQYS